MPPSDETPVIRPGESAYHRHLAEVEFARHMHPVPLRAGVHCVIAGTLVGLLVGSEELQAWTTFLPTEFGIRNAAFTAASWWHSQMQALGTADIFPFIRDHFRAFQYFTLS